MTRTNLSFLLFAAVLSNVSSNKIIVGDFNADGVDEIGRLWCVTMRAATGDNSLEQNCAIIFNVFDEVDVLSTITRNGPIDSCQLPLIYHANVTQVSIFAADVTNDGRLDMIIMGAGETEPGSPWAENVTICENIAPSNSDDPIFWNMRTTPSRIAKESSALQTLYGTSSANPEPPLIFASDIDGDSRVDLVGVHRLWASNGVLVELGKFLYAVNTSSSTNNSTTSANVDNSSLSNTSLTNTTANNSSSSSNSSTSSSSSSSSSAVTTGTIPIAGTYYFTSQWWYSRIAATLANEIGTAPIVVASTTNTSALTIEDYVIFFGDVNGDSKADLVAIRRSPSNTTQVESVWYRRILVEFSTGTTLRPVWTVSMMNLAMNLGGNSTREFRIFFGDVNGDKIMDIIAIHPNPVSSRFDATLPLPVLTTPGEQTKYLANIAYVARSCWHQGIFIEFGTTLGTFTSAIWPAQTPQRIREESLSEGSFDPTKSAYDFAVGDVNGDGRADVIGLRIVGKENADDYGSSAGIEFTTTLANGSTSPKGKLSVLEHRVMVELSGGHRFSHEEWKVYSVGVALTNATTVFGTAAIGLTDGSNVPPTIAIYLADLNGDGRKDLIGISGTDVGLYALLMDQLSKNTTTTTTTTTTNSTRANSTAVGTYGYSPNVVDTKTMYKTKADPWIASAAGFATQNILRGNHEFGFWQVSCVDDGACDCAGECSYNPCALGAKCDDAAICTVQQTQAVCVCNSGYSGSGDPGTCFDINECLTGNGGCDSHAYCTNTVGAFTCTCMANWVGGGVGDGGCVHEDECALRGATLCNSHALCTTTDTSHICTCNAGWSGSGVTCSDIDECALVIHNCAMYAVCNNTAGSFDCFCTGGYTGSGTAASCSDVNECLTSNGGCIAIADGGVCTNSFGSFSCSCTVGFSGDGKLACADVNECLTNNGGCDTSSTKCTNNKGSFICACLNGFTTTAYSTTTFCQDYDECAMRVHNCASVASCSNTVGSFTCSCNAGWTGTTGVTCSDVNECSTNFGGCDSINGVCTNTAGSFTCGCAAGYSLNSATPSVTTCYNIDECASGTHNCASSGATCVDSVGSFTCSCNVGWTGSGVSCTDINECLLTTNGGCSDINANFGGQALCVNAPGSYYCSCNSGFYNALTSTGKTVRCEDIDECESDYTLCSPGTCVNLAGTYRCDCGTGYVSTGTACADVNECLTNSGGCDTTRSQCINTAGSFYCTCKDGFSGSGTDCTNIDECALGTHQCSFFATCTDTTGSYTCQCKSGFVGDGVSCNLA